MQIRLKVLNGKSAGRELPVPYEEFVIGRSEECHLRPKSDAISRKHCVLRVRENALFVEDLGSKNGTYVNDVKLEGEHEVQDGDVCRVGRFEFQIVREQAAAADQSVDAQEETKAVIADESWADDNDITKWLEEGEAANYVDPATKQLRLEPAEKAILDTKMLDQAASQTVLNKEEAAAEEAAKEKEKEKEKKEPGKLPPRAAVTTNNSREAAADMLKKFFNRP